MELEMHAGFSLLYQLPLNLLFIYLFIYLFVHFSIYHLFIYRLYMEDLARNHIKT